MAKEVLRFFQNLSVYMLKNETVTLFLLPIIEILLYVYKSNPLVCFLLPMAGLISHPAQCRLIASTKPRGNY